MPYRKDIDGLRALAVLPVVFFHLGWGAPGGYIGVDVFFVISGFLIGSIVIREVESGSFSLLRFWERRVRRILPALTAVVVATAVAGCVWMIPAHLEELGKSIMAQPALVANVYFWQESGYFEVASEYQPLLQTWSLAVEEQFYLFFPLVMILFFKLGRRAALIGVLILIALSLGWSVFSTKVYPSLSFYLLPSRIWELDLGVILALLQIKRDRPRWINEVLSWGGIGCILTAVFTFSLNTPFPGYTALLPCLGAALVIFGNAQQATSSSALLGWGPIRFVGLISYSLYLWHWPLIVFARYQSAGELSVTMKVVILLLSLICATLSWRFIEKPFRKAKEREAKGATRKVLAIGAVTSIFTLGLGVAFSESEGLPKRFSAETLELRRVDSPFSLMRSRSFLEENGTLPVVGELQDEASSPPMLVWGDSHAISLLPAFDVLGKKHGTTVYAAVQPATPPLAGTWTPRIGKDFLEWGEAVLEQVDSLGIEKVIIVGRWDFYLRATPDGDQRNLISDEAGTDLPAEVFERAVRRSLARLAGLGVEVWFIEDVPFQPHSVPETVMLASIQGRNLNGAARSLEAYQEWNHEIAEIIDRSLVGLPVRRLDPVPLLTDADGILPMARNGKALYSDDHHLSPFGAQQLEPLIEEIFE
ncbi:MAG: acyltransferase family protein [Verrucomicrobiales bacterium]|nr:acyltransferase family protein [Verrucomicrobiales bacterium]